MWDFVLVLSSQSEAIGCGYDTKVWDKVFDALLDQSLGDLSFINFISFAEKYN